MRNIKVLFVFLVLLCTSANKTYAQQLSDKAFISLLTCGPGDELYSVFGHTAIRVNDPVAGVDIVYNYGTFDFSAPNFYLRFVKGDLQYFVSVSSYEDFVYTYQYYDRDVYEQVLNLTPQQEQKIFKELNDVLASDRKFYTYKFIDRNCTTMAGDVIELGTGSKISNKNSDNGKTYRKIIYEYLDNHFIESFGINLMFGIKTDQQLDELFLPTHLMEGVSNTQTANGVLAGPVVTINKSKMESTGISILNNYYTFCAIVLILMFFTGKKNFYVPFLVLAGVIGVFFCVVGFYSFHEEIVYNYNALLINPLFLILLFFIYRNNRKWTIYSIYACLACILVYIIIMLNKPHLPLAAPLIILITTILIRLLLKQKTAKS
jgi:hypothetical protein